MIIVMTISRKTPEKLFLAVLLILVFLSSCDRSRVFEENRKIENSVWLASKPVTFNFEVTDTVSRNNFYINLRNGDDYPYMNIFVFITTRFPNGKTSVDTLECFLADQRGKWLGSGLGDIYDNRILFKENKAFPIPGKYEVEIAQAMRQEELPSIYDVGFRVAKTQ